LEQVADFKSELAADIISESGADLRRNQHPCALGRDNLFCEHAVFDPCCDDVFALLVGRFEQNSWTTGQAARPSELGAGLYFPPS